MIRLLRRVWRWALGRLFRRPDGDPTLIIKPPIQKFTGHDDRLRIRSEQRRHQAESMRIRAARMDSGSQEPEQLRRVK